MARSDRYEKYIWLHGELFKQGADIQNKLLEEYTEISNLAEQGSVLRLEVIRKLVNLDEFKQVYGDRVRQMIGSDRDAVMLFEEAFNRFKENLNDVDVAEVEMAINNERRFYMNLEPIQAQLDFLYRNQQKNFASGVLVFYSNRQDLPNRVFSLELDRRVTSFGDKSIENSSRLFELQQIVGPIGNSAYRIAYLHSEQDLMLNFYKSRDAFVSKIKKSIGENIEDYEASFFVYTTRDTCEVCARSIRRFCYKMSEYFMENGALGENKYMAADISFSMDYPQNIDKGILEGMKPDNIQKREALQALASEILERNITADYSPEEQIVILRRLLELGRSCAPHNNKKGINGRVDLNEGNVGESALEGEEISFGTVFLESRDAKFERGAKARNMIKFDDILKGIGNAVSDDSFGLALVRQDLELEVNAYARVEVFKETILMEEMDTNSPDFKTTTHASGGAMTKFDKTPTRVGVNVNYTPEKSDGFAIGDGEDIGRILKFVDSPPEGKDAKKKRRTGGTSFVDENTFWRAINNEKEEEVGSRSS